MIIVDTDYLCWLVKKSIKERKNMHSIKVVTSSLAESMVVLMPGGVGVNSCAFPKDQIDDVIQALQAYKAALPKPCVHAELIKQYADAIQSFTKEKS
jgi:hypothetical protein